MEFSFKQVATLVLSLMVFAVALQSLELQLPVQGEQLQDQGQIKYIDMENLLNKDGLLMMEYKKPAIQKNIFHMRRGNYVIFDYKTLLHAVTYQGENIKNLQDATINGTIDGRNVGVNILHCTVLDQYGNFRRYKIAVLIEGKANINTLIRRYEDGKLL